MANYHKWLLVIPLLIMLLGAYLLLSGEAAVVRTYTTYHASFRTKAGTNAQLPAARTPAAGTLQDALQANRSSALQYFLLGSGLLVLLLVLPKLTEVSFSPANGFSLKILQEAKEAVDEITSATEAIELKTRQTFRQHNPEAVMPASPELNNDLVKLQENKAKLAAYANILEKIATSGKGRKV